MVTEVQNIIGQVREQGMQVKEFADKIRRIERNDTNERFGLELAGALSRIETVSKEFSVPILPFTAFYLHFSSWRRMELKTIRRKPLEVWPLMWYQNGWINWRLRLVLWTSWREI